MTFGTLRDASLPHAGAYVADKLLCLNQVQRPLDFVHVLTGKPPVRPDQTARQWAEDIAKDPTCASCHHTLNGLSFALQTPAAGATSNVDEKGLPLDTSGWLDADLDGRAESSFTSPTGLNDALAKSPTAHTCMARRWLEFVTERPMEAVDACAVEALAAKLWKSNGDLYTMILDSVESPAFSVVPADRRAIANHPCSLQVPVVEKVPDGATLKVRRTHATIAFALSQISQLAQHDQSPCAMSTVVNGLTLMLTELQQNPNQL